jgi:hypothetical protein
LNKHVLLLFILISMITMLGCSKEPLKHKPINRENIDAIHVWKKGHEIKSVQIEDYIEIIDWINSYPSDRIKETKISATDAQIVIDLDLGKETVVINYVQGEIYFSRDDYEDDTDNIVKYLLLDELPELTDLFEELLKLGEKTT